MANRNVSKNILFIIQIQLFFNKIIIIINFSNINLSNNKKNNLNSFE